MPADAFTKPLDNPADAFLSTTDGVAISFWIISIAMNATTVLFYTEDRTDKDDWKTSANVEGWISNPDEFLSPTNGVAISFCIISIATNAATVFFDAHENWFGPCFQTTFF